jgi:hypothetical protein
MSRRYKYIGTCAEPGYGTVGEAIPASGACNVGSVEEGAWLFRPDGSGFSYYVNPETDLQYIGQDVSEWSDAQRFADDLLHDPGACRY